MKRAFYMIENKPTSSNIQTANVLMKHNCAVFCVSVCLHCQCLAANDYILFRFGIFFCSLSIQHHEFCVHVFDWIVKLYKSFAYEIDLSVWCRLNVCVFFSSNGISLSLAVYLIACHLSLYFTLATASCRHSIF